MKHYFTLCMVIIFAVTAIAVSSEIDGKWKDKIKGPMGETEIEFNLKTEGNILTGTVTGPMGEQNIQNGKIDGNKFSFETQMGGNLISHKGMIEGNVMKVSLAQNGMEFELHRVVETIDINGSWIGTLSMPEGGMGMGGPPPEGMKITFVFEVEKNSLKGVVKGPMGDMPISNGKINGSEFYFDVNAGGMAMGHQCIVQGDSIKMQITGGPGGMGMTLKRAERQ